MTTVLVVFGAGAAVWASLWLYVFARVAWDEHRLLRPRYPTIVPADEDELPDVHRDEFAAMHDQLAQRGFRWFGVARITYLDSMSGLAGIWWNGDRGLRFIAYSTVTSLGPEISLLVLAESADGTTLAVSNNPLRMVNDVEVARGVNDPRLRTVDALLDRFDADFAGADLAAGWPAPDHEWDAQNDHEHRSIDAALAAGHLRAVGTDHVRAPLHMTVRWVLRTRPIYRDVRRWRLNRRAIRTVARA